MIRSVTLGVDGGASVGLAIIETTSSVQNKLVYCSQISYLYHDDKHFLLSHVTRIIKRFGVTRVAIEEGFGLSQSSQNYLGSKEVIASLCAQFRIECETILAVHLRKALGISRDVQPRWWLMARPALYKQGMTKHMIDAALVAFALSTPPTNDRAFRRV
jgi:hypothetical protein